MNSLPQTAAAKLAALAQSAADADALARAAAARIEEAERALAILENRRDAASSSDALAAANAEVQRAQADLERLRELHRERQSRRASDAQLLARLRQFLAALPPGATIEAASPVRATPRDGETPAGAVERVRAEIAAAQVQLQDVRSAPLPHSDLKKQVRAQVAALAELGRPAIEAKRAGVEIRWRTRKDATTTGATPRDVAAFYAWLAPDALTARLEAEIDALPVTTGALTAAERAAREAEWAARILDLERQEESLIEAGAPVARRPNADPRAVLGIRDATRAPSRAAAA